MRLQQTVHTTSIPGWEGSGCLVRYTFGVTEACRAVRPNAIPPDAWTARDHTGTVFEDGYRFPGSTWGPGPSVHDRELA